MPFAAPLVLLSIVAFYLWRFWTFTGWRVGGDGFYSWIFARSLAFDNDLLLGNDYAVCGDPWHVGLEEGGGRPANPFYLGPALLWAPFLKLARALVTLPADASPQFQAGCEGPLAKWTLAIAPFTAGVTLWIGYRLARRWVSERVAIVAMVVVALCSTLLHFGSLIAVYSHVWAALGVAVGTLTFVRAVEQPDRWQLLLVAGLGAGFAALMRVQGAILLLAPAMALFWQIVQDARAGKPSWRPWVYGPVVLVGFMAFFWVQLYANKLLYGHWWVVPQGHTYLQLGHGHPWQVLFASRSGLLSWHPLMWLGVLGFGVLLWKKETRLIGVCILVPAVIDLYINASAYWHSGGSFGARRLTTMSAPFVATAGVMLAAVWQWLQQKPGRTALFAATGWVVPWAVINVGASNANVDGQIPYDREVPAPQLYGDGLRHGLQAIHERVGNPLVLPAAVTFWARYGMQPKRYDDFSGGGMFHHNYRPVFQDGPDLIDFTHQDAAKLLADGQVRDNQGLLVRGGRQGRFLSEVDWPWITHIVLDAVPAGDAPVTLTIRNRSFFFTHDVATVTLQPGGHEQEIAVPAGAFDSGINEVLLDTPADVRVRHWRWVDKSVHDTSLW